MKRKLCLILVFILMMSLCACGKKPEAPAEPQITAAPDESMDNAAEFKEGSDRQDSASDSIPAAQMANPWHDITEAEAKELCPKSFIAPENAQNVQWRVLDSTADPSGIPGALVQLSFDLDGNSFTAREQITGDPDAEISGMYYDWTHQMDVTLRNWADITCRTYRWIGEEGYADLCSWYDAESETSYSVSVTASDLDGFDLCAIAEALHG